MNNFSFNRTILELKVETRAKKWIRGKAFNRTILELKEGYYKKLITSQNF